MSDQNIDVNEDFTFDHEFKDEASGVHGGIKVWIRRDRSGLGPGGYRLFKAVERSGSVKKACEMVGISYSKGWTIIHGVENELGLKIVERQQGGAGGGKASLTVHGEQVLEFYETYHDRVARAADEIFEELCKKSGLF